MTKEELRSKILELEEAMREEDSKSTTAKLSDEWDELMSKLEDVIYDELEGVAVKIFDHRFRRSGHAGIPAAQPGRRRGNVYSGGLGSKLR